jgi:predicted Zn-dependent protease
MDRPRSAGPAEKAVNFYGLDKEAALGKQMATDLQRQTTSIDSPTVRVFLAQLGQDLAAQVPDLKFRVTFSPVIDDP